MRTLALILCLATGPVLAADTTDGVLPQTLSDARAAIDSEDYVRAIAILTAMNAAGPGDADVLNLLGYSTRKSGDLAAAEGWYAAALQVDPNHLGALEYQGELFVMQGRMDLAQANLNRLAELCGDCEERLDLGAAMTAAGGG